MANIKLKDLLNEQWSPDTWQKQLMHATGDMVKKSKINNGIAYKVVGLIKKSAGGSGTDEQGILNALQLITSNEIYKNVLLLVQKQPISEFESGDIWGMHDPVWDRLKGRGWKTVMQWIQIKEFNPLLPGDADWLKKYSKILIKFNPNEVVGTRPKGDASNTDPAGIAGDTIGFGDSNAWDDPEFRSIAMNTIAFATAFIPVVGWAASALSLGLNSADRYKQGNMREAGLQAVCALIPIVGKGISLIAKMPGVAKLGERGMAALGRKLALSGDPVLSALERLAIKDVWKYKYALKNGIDNYVKASLANQVTNSVVRDRIRKQLGQRGANIIFKIADGSIKTSVLVTKLAVPLVAYDAGVEQYHTLFDKLYAIPKAKKNTEKGKQFAKQYQSNPDNMFNVEPITINTQNKKK